MAYIRRESEVDFAIDKLLKKCGKNCISYVLTDLSYARQATAKIGFYVTLLG